MKEGLGRRSKKKKKKSLEESVRCKKGGWGGKKEAGESEMLPRGNWRL